MNTTYFLNQVMGNLFKTKETPALPSEYYIGLSSTAPNISGGNVTEPLSNSGYKRVKLENLSEPADGVITMSRPFLLMSQLQTGEQCPTLLFMMRWRPEIYLCMTPYPPLVMLRPQLS